MILRDVLTKLTKIEYRMLFDEKSAKKIGEKECLFGFCEWNGCILRLKDGDSYKLTDKICGFLEMPDRLVCWIPASVLTFGEEVNAND